MYQCSPSTRHRQPPLEPCDRIARLDAADLDTHVARGNLLFTLDHHDEALTVWRQALAQATEPGSGLYNPLLRQ